MPVQAAAAIPWKELIKVLPSVVATARELFAGTKQKAPAIDPQGEVKSQIAAIVERLQMLETSEANQASLLKEIAEQLQGVSAGLAETARKSSISLWASVGGIAIAFVALLAVIAK